MRTILIISLLWVFTSASIIKAQNDTTGINKDSLIIINAYDYDLSHGISMFHRFCPNQKTYNKQNVLLREINYKKSELDEKISIEVFIYYFYNDNNQLISEEYYLPDGTFNYLIKYTYNPDNLLINKSLLLQTDNKLSFKSDTLYNYKEKKLTQIISRNSKKKKTSKTIVNYLNDKEVYISNFKSTDGQPSQIITEKLLDEGRVIEEVKFINYSDSLTDTLSYKYKYTTEGKILEQSVQKNNTFMHAYIYEYYPDSMLKSISKINEKGEKLEFRVFEIKKIIHSFGGFESKLAKEK